MFRIFLQETFVVVDADLYLPCTSDISSYFNIPSGMQGKITYDNNGMTISGLSSYQQMVLNTTYSTPKTVEFEVVSHSGSSPDITIGKIDSTWIYMEVNTNGTQVEFVGTKYTVGSTNVGKYKLEADMSEVRLYRENTLIHTYTGALNTIALYVGTSTNRSSTIKDIIIKAL